MTQAYMSLSECGDLMDKRVLHRNSGNNLMYPVSCVLRGAGAEYVAEVVNYHFKGACLRTDSIPDHDREGVKNGEFKLDFYLGQTCLQSDIPYRVSWRDERESLTFGVEFQNKLASNVERSVRFITNANIPIQVSCKDPLDPHRNIFFQVVDVSESGMLLSTSLSNKHLMPGMKLTNAQLQIPSQPTLALEIGIENARPGSNASTFFLGVTIRDKKREYAEAIRTYLPLAVPHLKDADQYLQKLAESPFQSKKLKNSVTYRIVQTQEQYEQVLKLRFSGYGKHDKIKSGTTWQEQGEGLESEGMILGAYLGSQLVCSMELRFGSDKLPLRVEKMLGTRDLPGVDLNRVVELNKLVIHPNVQGSDLVLGMLQRAHTIVVNRGQLDVLGVATDHLKGLYEGVGAASLGVRFPHPFLENEHLNLMLVRREVYHDGLRFNPHAWTVVYKTVHEHFVALGMAKERTLTFKERLVATATKFIMQRKKLSKSGKPKRAPQEHSQSTTTLPGSNTGFIDPKWTRQEIVASVMLPYVREAALMIGEDKVQRILGEIGVSERYISKQSNWLSIAFLDAFLDEFAKFGDTMELSKRAGKRSMKRDMLGLNYFVLKHFMTPELAYAAFSKIMPKFNRTRTYEVTENGPGRVRLSLGLVSPQLLPKHADSCHNWYASFEAYIELMTGKPGRVKKLTCCYEGAKSCNYEVLWDRSYLKITPFLPWIGASIGGFFSYNYLEPILDLDNRFILATACFSIILLAVVCIRWRWLRSDYNTSYQEFLRFQQDAAEKYAELQQSKSTSDELYREARIVEQTMRNIQQKDDIGSLLQTALDAVCVNFNFDRGFAMIVDENRKILRTAAVAGIDGRADALWKYSVDVSVRKENAMLLSSVYHSGSSVIINDLESHRFQLNEASQALIQQFGSAGFVMVAIPAKKGSWGVMIADKKTQERHLTRRDLVVLERLSQQIGVALDKRSDLERERNLRTHFQRYAPSALLLASQDSEQQVILGAQLRRVGVLFLDIRGFTKMSETLPPAKTVEMINGLFSLLDPIVRRYGGIVDKYLGDGALVTWGTLGASAPNSSDLMNCGVDLLKSLEVHNQSLKQRGLMPIKIGIGLHIGEALVGTIGSSERLEYTAIGPAVNLASRLESLCKMHDAEIVASDELITELGSHPDAQWSRVDGVQVRGIERHISIWTYKQPSQSEFENTLEKIA